MSTFLNRMLWDEDTRLLVNPDDPAVVTYKDGLAYDEDDQLIVTYGDTPEFFQAGIGFTEGGAMLVIDASAGLPADTVHQSGLPISAAESRLCVDPTNPVTYHHQGVSFTNVGAVAVSAGGEPPPVEVGTFDSIVLIQPDNAPYDSNRSTYAADIYYGITAGADGWSEDRAAFLAAHPGGTTEDYIGDVADFPATVAIPATAAFTPTQGPAPGAHSFLLEGADLGFGEPYPALKARWIATTQHGDSPAITLTFAALISSVGFRWGSQGVGTLGGTWTAKVYNGVTLVDTLVLTFLDTPRYGNYVGYYKGGAAPPASNRRITGDGDVRVTGDGDTRIWK